MTARLDHVVLGAASLDAGAAAFERVSGVRLPAGGAHLAMGTHNLLARLGTDAYLEIIAIDPAAPGPPRPRWFGLDEPDTVARFEGGFAPLAWVVAVDDLDAALARVAATGIDPGRPLRLERGELSWRIAVRDDGSRVEGGAFPGLIEWPAGTDAPSRMADLGLGLERLRVTHPEPARIDAALAAIGAGGLADIGAGVPGVAVTLAVAGRTVSV